MDWQPWYKDYFEFDRCREAFATGQKDARPEVHNGVYVRRRGRTTNQWTVLSFHDPMTAWELIKGWRAVGDRVQCVNYTSPCPTTGVPIVKGPVEYHVSGGYDLTFAGRSSLRRWKMRKALNDESVTVDLDPPIEDVMDVFTRWVAWANDRYFMVFKGHYKRWIELYYSDPLDTCRLLCIRRTDDGTPLGIFGWETDPDNDQAQVIIVKHVDELSPLKAWLHGMKHITQSRILCGSTADELKQNLGFESTKSWKFDISVALQRVNE